LGCRYKKERSGERSVETNYEEWNQPVRLPTDSGMSDAGIGRNACSREKRGHAIGPFLSGKYSVWERNPSPIQSSNSSVVAVRSTGRQPRECYLGRDGRDSLRALAI
jgi:hypothetical protein